MALSLASSAAGLDVGRGERDNRNDRCNLSSGDDGREET